MAEYEAPQEAKKSKTTRNIIIAVVVLLFLCCCSLAVIYGIVSTGILEEIANGMNF
jgi:flagellar basal body-associated protein FliL